MSIAPLAEKLGLETIAETLQSKFRTPELGVLEAAASSIAKSIRNDTLTLSQIDSFIKNDLSLVPTSKNQDVLEYLLCTRAGLLFVEGKREAGLREYDKALRIKAVPSTWALKGTALLQLERWDEAFGAYRKPIPSEKIPAPERKTTSLICLSRGAPPRCCLVCLAF